MNSKLCHANKYNVDYLSAIYFRIHDIKKFKESFNIFRTNDEIYMTFSFGSQCIYGNEYIYITARNNVTKIALNGTYFDCYYCIKKNVTIKINGQKYCDLLNKFDEGILLMYINEDAVMHIRKMGGNWTMKIEYL
jgi:hypothetical protein